jgi:hypothetical protein
LKEKYKILKATMFRTSKMMVLDPQNIFSKFKNEKSGSQWEKHFSMVIKNS